MSNIVIPTATWQDTDADQFRVGDIWESPRGQKYTVVEHIQVPGKKRQAVLLSGEDCFYGKRVLRDWDDIGSFDRGTFWTRPRAGQPTPMLTPARLREWASSTGVNTADQHLAHLCADWMEKTGLKQATHVGPLSAIALPSLEEVRGQTVYLKAGAHYRSLHPNKNAGTVSRTSGVKVADILRGAVNQDSDECIPPEICWAGPDRYWCYIDVNAVIIPSVWAMQHRPPEVAEDSETRPFPRPSQQ